MSTFVRRRKTKKQDALAKQVRKNTKVLGQREQGRLLTTMDTTPDTTAVMLNCAAIAVGDDEGDRSGREIHAESISIRGSIAKAAASTATSVRFMLLRDNLGSTTPPTLADLFTGEGNFFDNKHRLMQEQNMKRFTIFWDYSFVLNENFDGQVTTKLFKYYKKLNFKMTFTGTTGATEGKNSLWLLTGSDEASSVPIVAGDIVFKFTDM